MNTYNCRICIVLRALLVIQGSTIAYIASKTWTFSTYHIDAAVQNRAKGFHQNVQNSRQ